MPVHEYESNLIRVKHVITANIERQVVILELKDVNGRFLPYIAGSTPIDFRFLPDNHKKLTSHPLY